MSHFNEHALEMSIMELFEQQGYSCQNDYIREVNVRNRDLKVNLS